MFFYLIFSLFSMSALIKSDNFKPIPVTFIEDSIKYYNETKDKEMFKCKFSLELCNKSYNYWKQSWTEEPLMPLLDPHDDFEVARKYECFVEVFKVYDSIMNE